MVLYLGSDWQCPFFGANIHLAAFWKPNLFLIGVGSCPQLTCLLVFGVIFGDVIVFQEFDSLFDF